MPKSVEVVDGQGAGYVASVKVGAYGRAEGWYIRIRRDELLVLSQWTGGVRGEVQRYRAPHGTYARIRQRVEAGAGTVEGYAGPNCRGHAVAVVLFTTGSDTEAGLIAACPHAPTEALRDEIAAELRALVPQ
jgi:hypothetical protein